MDVLVDPPIALVGREEQPSRGDNGRQRRVSLIRMTDRERRDSRRLERVKRLVGCGVERKHLSSKVNVSSVRRFKG